MAKKYTPPVGPRSKTLHPGGRHGSGLEDQRRDREASREYIPPVGPGSNSVARIAIEMSALEPYPVEDMMIPRAVLASVEISYIDEIQSLKD